MSSELQPQQTGGALTKDEKQWGMFAHLSALAGFIIPFGNIIGPIVVWAMKKGDMPYVDRQGKEAINFQLSITIYMFVSILLMLVVIGMLTALAVGLAALVLPIIAALKANNGEEYRYPLTIRFLS